MNLTPNEQIIERIALLLLQIEPTADELAGANLSRNQFHFDWMRIAAERADNMAQRAYAARTIDPSLWEKPGSPQFNERMARLRTEVERKA